MPLATARRIAALPSDDLTISDALLFQKALALIILIFCPLRISTLLLIRLDQNMIWANRDILAVLILSFTDEDLKNDHPAIMPLPRECSNLVRIYVERLWPLLAPGQFQFLFTGAHEDRGKHTVTMSRQIKLLVYEKLGFDVSPHIFRHIVHVVVLNRFPGAYAMIARVLTHRSINTTIQNYAYMDVELSMRAYQNLVLDEVNASASRVRATDTAIAYGIDSWRGGHA